jgi:alanine racemase
MAPRNRRIIDLTALENNMKAIRASVPDGVKVMAVVKADGYGHGAYETAQASVRGGAEMLAVATVSEGVHLRKRGIRIPILVLGAVTEEDVRAGAEYDLIQTVCSDQMVRLCENAAVQAGKRLQENSDAG